MAATRRLTAILVADVVGYSRLMGADEEGTHQRLRAHLGQLVEPKIREHKGRTVKNTGDGLLAEFASVVDAVRCAAEIQRGMIDHERRVADEWRIWFRIGVNLGDVIVEDDDIFGDGVNVAARLEALAESGGICMSRTVREQIRDKLPYPLDDLGEQNVKNITRPVRVYALRPEAVAELPALGVPVTAARRRGTVIAALAAVALAALVIVAIGWWVWPAPKTPPTSPAASASISQPLVAPRLSIVVLPFANLSNDLDQQYFADGITEDLTTDLSRIEDMFVISANTAFSYKNKSVDTKQIGRALGVRYVLEGSVQRSGKQVRVNAQLIDAHTDAHLWAQRFEGDTGDLFALQNEITSRIAIALNLELVAAEVARPTQNSDALDYVLRGRSALSKPASSESYAEAIGAFEHALALDPDSVDARSWLAVVLMGRILDFGSNSPNSDIQRADTLANEALAAAPRSPFAHYAKANVLRVQRRCREAIREYETVLALNRNWVGALANIGRCKMYVGPIEEAIPAEEQAIRLSPRDPNIAFWYTRIGEVHLLQSQVDEAILWLDKARTANEGLPYVHGLLASVYGLKGETERAAAELAEARRLGGERYWTSIAAPRAYSHYETPAIRSLAEATIYAGLRKAGMPEK